jgi:hypothetical protein
VHRHWSRHIDAKRKARLLVGPVQEQALRARIAEENSSVIDQLRVTRAGLYESYDVALKVHDLNSVALLAGKIHENLRITGNITGELANSPLVQINNSQNNVTMLMESAEFTAFQARLIGVLRAYPEARLAVLAEFERLDAPDGSSGTPQLTHQGQTFENEPAKALETVAA